MAEPIVVERIEALLERYRGSGEGVTAPTDDAVPFFDKNDAASGEVDPFAGLDLPETAALRKPVEGLGTPSQLAGTGSPGSDGGSSPLSEQPHTTSAYMRTRIGMGPGEAMGVPAQRRPDSADLGGAAPQKTEVRLREVDGCPPPQYITFRL